MNLPNNSMAHEKKIWLCFPVLLRRPSSSLKTKATWFTIVNVLVKNYFFENNSDKFSLEKLSEREINWKMLKLAPAAKL